MPMSDYIRGLRDRIGTTVLEVPTVSVLVFDERERILLVRHVEGNDWTTPGGMIEPYETPADAALRETWEETGLLVALTQIVGHNRIEAAHGGCALIERWTSVAGVTGTSVNIYDRDRRRWHQTWVDSGGGLLQLDGSRVDTAIVLTGEAFDADAPNQSSRQRITWTPLTGGRVRQLWESSSDGGKTWTVAFDGLYVRQD